MSGVCAFVIVAFVTLRAQTPATVVYRLEPASAARGELTRQLSNAQIAILEKLNRADRDHLERQSLLVVPDVWAGDELVYSTMPASYEAGRPFAKLIVLHVPGQMFGAYEFGRLVRWGPISSGRPASPTRPGLFHLTWRSPGHTSSVDPEWFMPWYFNFDNRQGLSLHEYSLPGRPASHRCVRLLSRDARWLFAWGDSWTLDATETRILAPGTPLFIVGEYDFSSRPLWQSLEWLTRPVELPPLPAVN